MDREDLDFVLDVTRFKTKAPWGQDPWKPVPPATKAALTRALHADAGRPRCSLAVEEFKKGRKGKRGAAAAAPDEDGIGTGARPPQPRRGETGLVVSSCGVVLIASRSIRKARRLSAALGRHARAPARPLSRLQGPNARAPLTLCTRGRPAGTGGDPELEAAEAANAPPPPEEEDEEELTAGEHAVKRRLENAAKKGRLNFQPKVETKARPPPRAGRASGLRCISSWRPCMHMLGRGCSPKACLSDAEPAAQAPAKKRGAAAGRGGAGRGARGAAQAGRGRGKP
jgi:hypothetical protein